VKLLGGYYDDDPGNDATAAAEIARVVAAASQRPNVDRVKAEAKGRAAAIPARRRGDLGRPAEALHESGTLTQDEVRNLLRRGAP
jgi:hypothetical protein